MNLVRIKSDQRAIGHSEAIFQLWISKMWYNLFDSLLNNRFLERTLRSSPTRRGTFKAKLPANTEHPPNPKKFSPKIYPARIKHPLYKLLKKMKFQKFPRSLPGQVIIFLKNQFQLLNRYNRLENWFTKERSPKFMIDLTFPIAFQKR